MPWVSGYHMMDQHLCSTLKSFSEWVVENSAYFVRVVITPVLNTRSAPSLPVQNSASTPWNSILSSCLFWEPSRASGRWHIEIWKPDVARDIIHLVWFGKKVHCLSDSVGMPSWKAVVQCG